MGDGLEYPKLRWPLDMRTERHEGKEVLILSCPLGISPRPLVLVAAVAPIITFFDGRMSIAEISRQFTEFGIQRGLVRELAELLDRHLFLATPRYFAAEASSREQFAINPIRPAALAGAGYPPDADGLREEVRRYLRAGAHMDGASPLVGIISPHIDYRRGGKTYGATYSALEQQAFDVFIIFGTAHQYSRRLFHLTLKHFNTPLGMLRADKELISSLAARYGSERSFSDEILHKREHSIELQTPFIAYFNPSALIVPILVGSFHDLVQTKRLPEQKEEYESFVRPLVELIRERMQAGQKICFIAGVDMAHLGRAFGDPEPLTEVKLQAAADLDRAYLEAVEANDKQLLFEHVRADQDARRICGFPPTYTMVDVMQRAGISYRAKVFEYHQAVDFARDTAVTFAGVGLYAS